jgi:alpha-galactosidase
MRVMSFVLTRLPAKAVAVLAASIGLASVTVDAEPLKVFILTGQSNMEGHAQTRTFPAVAADPETSDLYRKMVDAKGEPVVMDDVRIAYAYGNFSGDPVGSRSGKLTAGYGSQHHVGTGKIGPELTFGITMHERLGEPILLIKAAWGGKSLRVDFRPPSAGDLGEKKPDEEPGRYYRLLVEHVEKVLADPGKVHPAYDPKEGVELAGMVWFQGFNDLVGPYPTREGATGRQRVKDYAEYSRLLACLIRDVRKDLSAPELPFVVGVLGVGGKEAGGNTEAFRESMAAPAGMDEFRGNVANVFTENFWPAEIDAVQAKIAPIQNEISKRQRALKKEVSDKRELGEATARLKAEKERRIAEALTEEELFILNQGVSNRGFHYHGSAKFFAKTGEAFAEALLGMR